MKEIPEPAKIDHTPVSLMGEEGAQVAVNMLAIQLGKMTAKDAGSAFGYDEPETLRIDIDEETFNTLKSLGAAGLAGSFLEVVPVSAESYDREPQLGYASYDDIENFIEAHPAYAKKETYRLWNALYIWDPHGELTQKGIGILECTRMVDGWPYDYQLNLDNVELYFRFGLHAGIRRFGEKSELLLRDYINYRREQNRISSESE